jgi:Pregnancy-associated plasma protein-A
VGLVAAALLGSPVLLVSPAQAMVAPAPQTACPAGTSASDAADPTSRSASVGGRRIADTPRVSAAVADRVQQRAAAAQRTLLSDATSGSARAALVLPSYAVQVQIHVIHGTRRHEHSVSRADARQMFRILKAGYAGAESPTSEPMGFQFVLRRITISRNERWYHAQPGTRADKQMKKKLHRGTARTLNIYVTSPRYPGGGILLGYSKFPWQYRAHPKLDGVTVNVAGLPGGRARGYNLGDTVVHETGHWLGLLHTFQGGCVGGAGGDGVRDTPAEAVPSFVCTDRNSCDIAEYTDPANPTGPMIDLPDPIHNFMDYSYDSCMYQFTPGQHQRAVSLFAAYRLKH